MILRLYQCGGEQPCGSEIPLGLGYLLTNCQVGTWYLQVVKRREGLAGADAIGLSSCAWGLQEAIDILAEYPDTPVLLGGQGALWGGILDYPWELVVRGEGEVALTRWLARDLPATQRVVREEPVVVDSLAPPERGQCGSVVPMFTARGCPGACKFCCARAHWGVPRYHSPEYVVAEAQGIAERYPDARTIWFQDDTFAASEERVEELAGPWVAAGLDRRFGLMGFARSACFTERMARTLRAMGMGLVRFGVESGSDAVLWRMGKGATVDDHEHAFANARRAGLTVAYTIMVGTPGETEEDRELTRRFILRHADDAILDGHYRFAPWPGCAWSEGTNPLACEMRVRGIPREE